MSHINGSHYNSLYFINNNANAHIEPMILEEDNKSISCNEKDPIKLIIDEKGYKDTNKSCIQDINN